MRALSCLIPCFLVLAGLPGKVLAQDPPSAIPNAPASPAEPPAAAPTHEPADTATHAEKLDRLFGELKREPDPSKAEEIAGRIQAEWMESGSATVDLLMGRAAQSMAKKDNAAALDLLDQTIVMAPDYPEAWNRRATLNYTENRYGLSMADVEETLAREPRHFGALMGLAMMLEELGRDRQALDSYLKVLTVYPAMKEAQDAALRLSDELAGQAA